jgi:catechol 2,3-dioxygenase-like lactoylglutathione lyase family enzyme
VSLQHVALETRRADVDAETAFWALLGFEPVPVPPGLVGVSSWLQCDGLQVHLLFADAPDVPRQGHVAVVAAGYAETQAALRAAGFPVRDHTPYWGAPRCMTRTPGGHLVEVMAAPPS